MFSLKVVVLALPSRGCYMLSLHALLNRLQCKATSPVVVMSIVQSPSDLNLSAHMGQCYNEFLSCRIYPQLLFVKTNIQGFVLWP